MTLKIQVFCFKSKNTHPEFNLLDWDLTTTFPAARPGGTYLDDGIFICHPFQQQMKILKQ